MTLDDAFDLTPELKAAAQKELQKYRIGPLFTPPSYRGTVQRPGLIGGANWGGGAFDARVRRPVLQDDEPGEHRSSREARPLAVRTRAPLKWTPTTHASATPTRSSWTGLPLLKPPYGHLVALDLNRGAIKWRVPFGDTPSLRRHPALKGVDPAGVARRRPERPAWWRPPAVWSSAAAAISRFTPLTRRRARRSGERRSPRRGNGTPMTYRARNGRQFVVIATGGGEDASLMAFALDRDRGPERAALTYAGHVVV